jgi:hypothetical protein
MPVTPTRSTRCSSVRSATSDPFRLFLPVLFGAVGGVITAFKQGWWGLLAAVAIAAAVHGSMWLATVLLSGQERTPKQNEHDYFVQCLRAMQTLPPHETDIRGELNDLLLAVERARVAKDPELVTEGMDTLRKTAEQLANIGATASPDQVEYRLRLIKKSLRNILDDSGEETSRNPT